MENLRRGVLLFAAVSMQAVALRATADQLQTGVPSYVVTTTDDHNDGVCGEVDCTLREALDRTNAVAGPDTITFAPSVVGTITGFQFNVTDSTTIVGPGARLLAISGANGSRVLSVSGSGTSAISGLTIMRGWVTDLAINPVKGGGIYNTSTLLVSACTLSENSLQGGFAYGSSGLAGGAARGGAIFNGGSLTISRCTFFANRLMGGHGVNIPYGDPYFTVGDGGEGSGGAVYNATGGTLNVYNCTFMQNSAGGGSGGNNYRGRGGNGGRGEGGAIANAGTMNIYASTIVGNSGYGGGGGNGNNSQNNGTRGSGTCGLSALGGTSVLRNTIVANNTITGADSVKDVSGTFDSGGYNLVGIIDGGTGFGAIGDQIGSAAAPLDPLLGSLSANGGDTDTVMPAANSPAIDKGKSFSLSVDQRGLPRTADSNFFVNAPGGDGTDIGAFEINPFGGTIDSDHDGMPDEFEIFFGVNDPNDDPDGDGDSNLTEYFNGTNPNSSASFRLRVIASARNGNDIVVTFNGVASRTFQLERKGALSESWAPLSGASIMTNTTANAQLTHFGGASSGIGFYRVVLVP